MVRHARTLFLSIYAVHSQQLPVQTGVMNDVQRSLLAATESIQRDEGTLIVEEIEKLKYEIQHDSPLTSVALGQIS